MSRTQTLPDAFEDQPALDRLHAERHALRDGHVAGQLLRLTTEHRCPHCEGLIRKEFTTSALSADGRLALIRGYCDHCKLLMEAEARLNSFNFWEQATDAVKIVTDQSIRRRFFAQVRAEYRGLFIDSAA